MTSLQGNYGWMGPAPIDVMLTNRTGGAIAVGDVGVLDNGRVDAASTSNSAGLQTAGISNFIATTTATQPYGIYAVALQAVADDRFFRARLQGQCDAVRVDADVVLSGATKSVVIGPVTTTLAAQVLAANAAAVLTTAAAGLGVPAKVIFIPLTARTGAGLTDGWFSGIHPFGSILTVPN